MKRLSLSSLLACAALPLGAQTMPCAPREQVLGYVIDESGQSRLATAEAARGATIEVYASDSGGWTILLHLPDGRSCLMANGQGFQATAGLQPARGEPA